MAPLVALLAASLFEGVCGASLQQYIPGFIRQYTLIWLIASLIIVTLVAVSLIATLRALAAEPWAMRWWRWWLVLSVGGALSAIASAMLGVSSIFTRGGEAVWVGGVESSWAPVVFIALLSAIIGSSLVDFWLRIRIPRHLSDMKTLLANVEERQNEHLTHPLLSVRFRVGVIREPNIVRPYRPDAHAPSGTDASVNVPVHQPTIPQLDPTSTLAEVWQAGASAGWRLLIRAQGGGGKSTQLFLIGELIAAEARETVTRWQQKVQAEMRGSSGSAQSSMDSAAASVPDATTSPDVSALRFPVILDLSRWTEVVKPTKPCAMERWTEVVKPTKPCAMERWISGEIARTYHMRRRTAETWLREGRFFPLLDGLDALNGHDRLVCIQQTNQYLHDHADAPLVVACRTTEYEDIEIGERTPLALNQAVHLNPMKEDEARAYLHLGNVSAPLVAALCIPLLLSMAVTALAHEPLHGQGPGLSTEQQVAALLGQYVGLLLANSGYGNYLHGLEWLGSEMQRCHALAFRLDDLQFEWLPAGAPLQRYTFLMNRVGWFVKSVTGVLFALALCAIVVIAYIVGNGQGAELVFEAGVQTPGLLIGIVLIGAIGGVGFGAGAGNSLRPQRTGALLHHEFLTRLHLFQLAMNASVLGVGAAVVALLGGGLVFGLVGLISVGAIFGLLPCITLALEERMHNVRASFRKPDQPFLDSIHVALRTASWYILPALGIGGFLAGLAVAKPLWTSGHIHNAVSAALLGFLSGALAGLAFMGVFALIAILKKGGDGAIKNWYLRQTIESHVLPEDALTFVTQLRNALVLRRVGEGFTFIVHSRLLRDFLANAYQPQPEEGVRRRRGRRV